MSEQNCVAWRVSYRSGTDNDSGIRCVWATVNTPLGQLEWERRTPKGRVGQWAWDNCADAFSWARPRFQQPRVRIVGRPRLFVNGHDVTELRP